MLLGPDFVQQLLLLRLSICPRRLSVKEQRGSALGWAALEKAGRGEEEEEEAEFPKRRTGRSGIDSNLSKVCTHYCCLFTLKMTFFHPQWRTYIEFVAESFSRASVAQTCDSRRTMLRLSEPHWFNCQFKLVGASRWLGLQFLWIWGAFLVLFHSPSTYTDVPTAFCLMWPHCSVLPVRLISLWCFSLIM